MYYKKTQRSRKPSWKKSIKKPTGPTTAVISKSIKDGFLKVVAPWNQGFLDELKSSIEPGSRFWNADDKCWLVNEVHYEEVVALCRKYYNYTDLRVEESMLGVDEPNAFIELFNLIPDNLVEEVYRTLVMALHPDYGGDDELMKKLNKAYQEK